MKRRLLACVPILGLAVTGAVAAGPAAVAAGGPTETVWLYLSPPDPAGLDRLARSHLPVTERRALLPSYVPTAAQRREVVSRSQNLGLHIKKADQWVVTVTASAARIESLFGSARSVDPGSRTGRSLPTLPAGLRRDVAVALGGDETRPFSLPATNSCSTPPSSPQECYDSFGYHGDAIRTAYDGDSPTLPDGVETPTIATLQFVGWDRTDLTHWATGAGLPDPVASGQYTEVSVDGQDPTAASGASIEVALDQEALLGIAPEANQRAYFAPNNGTGQIDAILAVGEDTIIDESLNISALSISWGGCEDATLKPYFSVLHNAIAYTVAAGVTIFNSTGDNGAFCDNTQPSTKLISSPSDDPLVVAVGGTTLPDGTTPNQAAEEGWHGSGGGETLSGLKTLFPRPSWQPAVGTGGRVVPDIAVDANPTTGYTMYWSAFGSTEETRWFLGGGTSFSSPAAAAMLTNSLVSAGYPHGIGFINANLYANPTAFRDITTGNNGIAAGAGYDEVTGLGAPKWTTLAPLLLAHADPHIAAAFVTRNTSVPISVEVPATASYKWFPTAELRTSFGDPPPCDAVSYADSLADPPTVVHPNDQGVNNYFVVGKESDGTCHYGFSFVFLDNVPPTLSTSFTRSPATGVNLTASWNAADPGSGSGTGVGLDHFAVAITHPGATDYSCAPCGVGAAARTHQFTGKPGRTYTLTVKAYDLLGNVKTATRHLSVPLDDKNATLKGSWSHPSDGSAYRGSYASSTDKGATATWTADAKDYTVWFTTCSHCGEAKVTVGSKTKTVDLYATTNHYRVGLAAFSFTSAAPRDVVVKVLHTKDSKAKDFRVQVDGLKFAT